MGWISILYFFLWLLATILVLIFLILLLPVNLDIKGINGKYEFKIRLWFLELEKLVHMFPKRDKPKKKTDKTENNNKKKSGDYKQIIKYAKLVLVNAGKLLHMIIKRIKFKKLDLKLCIGGEDASKIAVEYGEICCLFYPLVRIFIDINKPKSYNFSVVPDFAAENIRADMDIRLKTRIFSFLIIFISVLRLMKSSLK